MAPNRHLMHSEAFVDKTPYSIYYTLLDQNQYHCSIRSMYRILDENHENIDRRLLRNHRDAVKPELIATGINQVWSWDITKLLSIRRLEYFHLYVIIDIFSRFVVGWLLADRECQHMARRLIQKTTLKYGIQPEQLTVHADNGPSMKSHTVSELLAHLKITQSHNRPYTSNDNPFSESQFKTLKYCPEFPERFESLEQARRFCRQFFKWYNEQHYHSGIAWLTPFQVHSGQQDVVLEKRYQTLVEAYTRHPGRFAKAPQRVILPDAVYINPPENLTDSPLHGEILVVE